MKKTLLTVLMSSSVIFLTACGSGDGDSVFNGPNNGIPVNNIQNPVVRVEAYTDPNTEDAYPDLNADRQLLTYKMLGVDGQEVQATSLIFIPTTTPPINGWKTVVWAHGTTGVADKCAPSKQGLGSTTILIQKLLDEGYVVVAPDYEGLGAPGNHPFLNLKSEAYSITDAVVAARKYLTSQGGKVSTEWLTVGHSQGGHAALGAAQYASRANLNYKGTIAVAPASNLADILKDGEDLVVGQPANIQIPVYAKLDMFTSLIVAGMQGHQIFVNYNQVFKPQSAAIAPIAETECATDVADMLGNAMGQYVSTPGNLLANYGRTQDNFMTVPVINNFLTKDSQPGSVKLNQRVIIYQGSNDTTVPEKATLLLKAMLESKGTTFEYIDDKFITNVADRWNHSTVVTENVDNIVTDVKSLMPIQ
ncbi:alpha/beta fold hydrolase [Acinetobacter sp. TSRC1-2]|uniref:alpha/beta hydrolase n=1 Tax=unclassified Acinetobacter TaxID=196816 RepID=UPI003CF0899E